MRSLNGGIFIYPCEIYKYMVKRKGKKRPSRQQVKMDGMMKPLVKGAVAMAGIAMLGGMMGGMAAGMAKK